MIMLWEPVIMTLLCESAERRLEVEPEHFRYEQAQTVPSVRSRPVGVAVNFTLDPLFQSEVANVMSPVTVILGPVSQDTLSGQLLQASSPLSHEGFHYSIQASSSIRISHR